MILALATGITCFFIALSAITNDIDYGIFGGFIYVIALAFMVLIGGVEE